MSTTEAAQAQAQRERGAELGNLKRWPELERLARGLLASDPEDPVAWCLLSWALINQGQSDAGRDAARHALGADSGRRAWAWRLIGQIEHRQGSRLAAVAAAREAIKAQPESWSAHLALAEFAVGLDGHEQEAQRAVARGLEIAPERADLHAIAGRLAYAAGRRDEAIAALHRALAIDSQHAVAQNELSRIMMGRQGAGALAAAATGFARGVAGNPSNRALAVNVDLAVLRFLIRIAFLTSVAGLLATCAETITHLSPVIAGPCSGGLAIYFAYYASQLSPPVRRRVWYLIGNRSSLLAPFALQVSALLVLGAAATTTPPGSSLLGAGVGLLTFIASSMYLRAISRLGITSLSAITAANARRGYRTVIGLTWLTLIAAHLFAASSCPRAAAIIWVAVYGISALRTGVGIATLRRRSQRAATHPRSSRST